VELARASRSVPDLVHHLRSEGHPAAWYLVRYGLTRLTGDPRAMQVAELVIVAGTYAVMLFASPFSPASPGPDTSGSRPSRSRS
jgi:hypothetical protein